MTCSDLNDYEPQRDHREQRAGRTQDLLRRRSRTADESERATLTGDVVVVNMGVAEAVASQYRGRGICEDDLKQVAYLALIHAATHYDHAVGGDFLSYCVPTIRGEIRHYFRDHGWMVRPPRRLQELQARVFLAQDELVLVLGRVPDRQDIADAVGATRQEVHEAFACTGCFTPVSLDQPAGTGTSTSIGDLLAGGQDERSAVETRAVLDSAIRGLNEHERRLLLLRFGCGLTQQEIGNEIGATQMQVSRMLRHIYLKLRDYLTGSPGWADVSA